MSLLSVLRKQICHKKSHRLYNLHLFRSLAGNLAPPSLWICFCHKSEAVLQMSEFLAYHLRLICYYFFLAHSSSLEFLSVSVNLSPVSRNYRDSKYLNTVLDDMGALVLGDSMDR